MDPEVNKVLDRLWPELEKKNFTTKQPELVRMVAYTTLAALKALRLQEIKDEA